MLLRARCKSYISPKRGHCTKEEGCCVISGARLTPSPFSTNDRMGMTKRSSARFLARRQLRWSSGMIRKLFVAGPDLMSTENQDCVSDGPQDGLWGKPCQAVTDEDGGVAYQLLDYAQLPCEGLGSAGV